ncbi:MAG: NFACT RNA binding domain-containing protein [Eubacteriales bacterium]|nr:NFACT RNA binding domain-containing protein [Eubacteriales bacterium]
MAFDAGMLACAVSEIRNTATGGRIEKIYQPERDEIVIQLRTTLGGRRILINAGSNNPRICYSALPKENPAVPPMFCLLLRKRLGGGKLSSIEQLGFERAVRLGFECRDEMGFECTKYLIAEVMGKYSNLIFTDGDMKVIAAHRPVDFTTSSRRQVLPGMKYELPPAQDKVNPLDESEAGFSARFDAAPGELRGDKFISGTYQGISSAVAREIVYRATRHTDTPLKYCDAGRLWRELERVMSMIRTGEYAPTIATVDGRPVEYAFLPLTQYGSEALRRFDSPGELLDVYYGERDREQKVRQRAADILHMIANANARISRKLEHQRQELAQCAQGEEYKRQGDLITANLYAIEKGSREAILTDYGNMREDGTFPVCRVELDPMLTPVANAQRLYKKYNKSKHATVELTRQIELGEQELEYLRSVSESLGHAETTEDLGEIRAELFDSGYASRMKGYTAPRRATHRYLKFVTDGGFSVLCGKNNTQNEFITHKVADKNDYWFHAKGRPGSHVILECGGREPGDIDFTQAARIAALYSGASDGHNVAVDYTRVRNLKKAPGAKPGFVIYHTNWTAYVTPDADEAARLRCSK